MPSFSDYFKLLDQPENLRPLEVARAIRGDRALADWQRSALLVQLGLRSRRQPATSMVERR